MHAVAMTIHSQHISAARYNSKRIVLSRYCVKASHSSGIHISPSMLWSGSRYIPLLGTADEGETAGAATVASEGAMGPDTGTGTAGAGAEAG
jgi:hypothetical protein